MPMQNLLSPRWMITKAVLFLVMAGLAAFVVLGNRPSWVNAGCLLLIGWSCSRAYYFAFYVVQHYVDPTFRFSGLLDFFRWSWRRRT